MLLHLRAAWMWAVGQAVKVFEDDEGGPASSCSGHALHTLPPPTPPPCSPCSPRTHAKHALTCAGRRRGGGGLSTAPSAALGPGIPTRHLLQLFLHRQAVDDLPGRHGGKETRSWGCRRGMGGEKRGQAHCRVASSARGSHPPGAGCSPAGGVGLRGGRLPLHAQECAGTASALN